MKTTTYLFHGKRKISLLLIFLLLLGAGCKDDSTLGLSSQDQTPPASPKVTQIENMNGAAIIHYEVPADADLLCVTAYYEINGKPYSTSASPYKNALKVEGFGKKGEYTVQLKSIDKSKNESAPVQVTVNPEESPVETIFESLEVFTSFGGIKIKWENNDKNNVIVGVLIKDDAGDWINLDNFYSSSLKGMATIRGMDTIPYTFGIVVRDRWDNYSSIHESVLTPLYEEELNKSKFREVTPLPNDASVHAAGYSVSKIWDGNTVSSCFHSGNPIQGVGGFITFDLGGMVKLSRYKMWQRTEAQVWMYSHNNLKHYVVYGCEEITAEMRETGSTEGWTLLEDAFCYKPSGEGPVTNEDKEYILNGDEHEIPIEAPSVRYIRIHMLENWSGGTITQIGEMSFWGQVIK